MPNSKQTRVTEFFAQDLNVWKFLYGADKIANPPPFNYFKYMGSMTTPPCEENIVWFVHSKPVSVGSTALSMIKDTLFAPGKTIYDKEPNYDGTNRDIQEIKNRKVFFYDREKSCVPYKDPKDKKEVGHWEKVVKDVDRYFFVKGAKPS